MTTVHNSINERNPANTKIWHLGQFREVYLGWRAWGQEEERKQFKAATFMPPALKWDEEECLRREKLKAERLIRRAKSKVRRLAYAYDMRRMWSLTIAGEVTDLEEAWGLWNNFLQRMKKRGLMPERYIVVPERQKRGVWHFHVITNKFVNVSVLSSVWKLGHCWESGGSAEKAALYASKYVGKAMGEEEGEGMKGRAKGKRRFRASMGMTLETSELLLNEEEVREGFIGEVVCKGGYTPIFSAAIEEDGKELGLWFLARRSKRLTAKEREELEQCQHRT